MNKSDIIGLTSEETSLTKTAVKAVIDSFVEHISQALERGESVKIAGLGIFEPRQRAARTGRNIANGEPVSIPARILPSFKASKELKERIK